MKKLIYDNKLAHIYDDLFGEINQDIDFYKYFIEQNKGVALEIGSGTGRLLLNYLQSRLHVEGLEQSQDMIKICLDKSLALNLNPIIYHQKVQNLNINKKYNTIFLPLYVFQNILEENEIVNSLKKIYDHLNENGQILISIFPPSLMDDYSWKISKIIDKENDKIILYENVHHNKLEQIQIKNLKHEIYSNDILKNTYLSEIKFRYYSKFELSILLKQAGFKNIEIFGDYTLDYADSESDIFIYSAIK